jgi:hypothetical protein
MRWSEHLRAVAAPRSHHLPDPVLVDDADLGARYGVMLDERDR